VSRQTINAIEQGRYDPSLPLAIRMAANSGRRLRRSSTSTIRGREARGSRWAVPVFCVLAAGGYLGVFLSTGKVGPGI
jgi:hypothetical protein